MSTFRQCQHIFEDGHTCGSAAVTGRDYCYHHLRHRGHRIRMLRARAENRQVFLDLPPLDSLSAVHSVACQIAQALAAGVIDVRSAKAMLSYLRLISQTLRHAETPAWQNNAYHNEQVVSYDSFESEFGLPHEADLNSVLYDLSSRAKRSGVEEPAFSGDWRPATGDSLLSSRAKPAAVDGVEGPAFSGDWRPATGDCLPPMPFSGHYCGDHHSRECECCRIGPDHPVTPESVEVLETCEKLGDQAAATRSKQLWRNKQRRLANRERKRYEAIALELNLRRAADRMSERKLAQRANEKPPCGPQLPDSGNCGVGLDSTPPRKPVVSTDRNAELATPKPKLSA